MRRLVLFAALAAAGCNSDSFDGTAVRVHLTYASSLGLDHAEVTLDAQVKTAVIAPELFLIVPDALAGKTLPISVWGEKAGAHTVFASAEVTPRRGEIVDVPLELAESCTPSCDGDKLKSCVAPIGTCPMGCMAATADAEAHCLGPVPSNGVPPTFAGDLTDTIAIASETTFNTETGEITGGLTRAGNTTLDAGISFHTLSPRDIVDEGGVTLGVFGFYGLGLAPTVRIRFVGRNAPVLLVASSTSIEGIVDVQANLDVPGPGGFPGGTDAAPAGGCGPGGPGKHAAGMLDSGGAGGASGSTGGLGNAAGAGTAIPLPGGDAHDACFPGDLEPLQGGSGGGRGSPGGTASSPAGGAGGGAIQITSLAVLTTFNGSQIIASGGGGKAPLMNVSDFASGGGGGAGGAILLEAPTAMIDGLLFANGGGGGGGGGISTTPTDGDNGGTSLTEVPNGGLGGAAGNDNNGSTGGGGMGAKNGDGGPDGGSSSELDGGGGGGGYGRIIVRGTPGSRTVAHTKTAPEVIELPLHP